MCELREYLIVGSSESSSNIFVVQHLYLECKEFFKLEKARGKYIIAVVVIHF